MQHSIWEADSHPAGQEIPRLLGNRKVHYSVHKSQPPVQTLCQINSVNLASSERCLPFRLSDQNFAHIYQLFHECYMPRPSESPDFFHPKTSGVAYKL
jgi:hypothetical protein